LELQTTAQLWTQDETRQMAVLCTYEFFLPVIPEGMNLDAGAPSSSIYADLLSVPEGQTKLECLHYNKIVSVRFEVSTVVLFTIQVFWDVTLCC
jgi:hypothetical protein